MLRVWHLLFLLLSCALSLGIPHERERFLSKRLCTVPRNTEEVIHIGIWTSYQQRALVHGVSILTDIAHNNVPLIPHLPQHVGHACATEGLDLVASLRICRD
jgi:hypothetical protein